MENHFCDHPACLAKVEEEGSLCDECFKSMESGGETDGDIL